MEVETVVRGKPRHLIGYKGEKNGGRGWAGDETLVAMHPNLGNNSHT